MLPRAGHAHLHESGLGKIGRGVAWKGVKQEVYGPKEWRDMDSQKKSKVVKEGCVLGENRRKDGIELSLGRLMHLPRCRGETRARG